MMGLGAWQAPTGPLAWGALGVALALLPWLASPALRARSAPLPERALVLGLALGAALVSALYVPLVLRGGPRIVDATAYWLESRIFATGHATFATAGPASSIRGRFLLETTPGAFAGIFPPGYPAVLAVFQRLQAPWVLGPLLAFALVPLTARLAAHLAPVAHRRSAMLVAGALSFASGALRYHTADTMAHGLVLVAGTGALVCMLHESRRAEWTLAAGACLGLVATTRFASALALGPVLLALAVRFRRSWHDALWLALGTLPFVVALGLYHRAVTGSPWLAPQSLYYLRADAPEGCFRFGFGAGIGCDFEHGDFVRAHFPDHVYGAWEALGVSARRLRAHALDAANLEPLLLLVILGARKLPRGRAWVVAALPLLVMLAYAPFYFDGNYPGGGARLWIDAVPAEHALIAVATCEVAWQGLAVLASALLGFAVHAAPLHAQLRDRDGGVPMWSDVAVAGAGALVLTNTDHGFDLGFDPSGHAPRVARLRGDANDVFSIRAFGRARLAFFDVERGLSLRDYAPLPESSWRFEGEHEWPLRWTAGATAVPIAAPCPSGRALELAATHEATFATSLWVDGASTYAVRLHTFGVQSAPVSVHVELGSLATDVVVESGCKVHDLGAVRLAAGDHDVRWRLGPGRLGFDALETTITNAP